MFRTALLILSGNAFSSLMTLLRTLIVARLISVEDYGIAATFAISLAIVEMMSALGLQQMIVRDSRASAATGTEIPPRDETQGGRRRVGDVAHAVIIPVIPGGIVKSWKKVPAVPLNVRILCGGATFQREEWSHE